MKVVHLLIGGEVAGGQLVALQLARAAREASWEAVFVAPERGEFVELAEAEGFRVRIVPLGEGLAAGALLRLWVALRAERPDVLHTHAHFALNVTGRLAGRLAGARVVSHMHIANVFRPGPAARRAQAWLDNATARLCTAIVAVSGATRDSLVEQGYPAGRVHVVHNGVAAASAAPRRPDGVPAGAPVLIEVARLAPVKGQRELIEALARLHRADAVALLVGRDFEAGGAFEDELRRVAAGLGVAERVVFAGYRDDVPELLAGADVFVLPSYEEGLPLTALEAMAAAKPVVAGRAGGTPEAVVHGETGLLVEPGDVEELTGALDGLLADPAGAARLGEAGRRRVLARFSPTAMCERVLALYGS